MPKYNVRSWTTNSARAEKKTPHVAADAPPKQTLGGCVFAACLRSSGRQFRLRKSRGPFCSFSLFKAVFFLFCCSYRC
ncbi:hypothetical protein CMV_020168 [Castanea mollissima]|uniref:Uncharacterized protein n=1 Tax=Castanea mollissima TaxID=60419 RepID=A0A8J4QID0_9ROSI|nr:hypothetical protein CMV_020168 [Castanea mollissima]